MQPDVASVTSSPVPPSFLCRETVLCPSLSTVLPLRAGQGRRKDQPTTVLSPTTLTKTLQHKHGMTMQHASGTSGDATRSLLGHIRSPGLSTGLQTWAVPSSGMPSPCYSVSFGCCEMPQLYFAQLVRKTKKSCGSAWQRR